MKKFWIQFIVLAIVIFGSLYFFYHQDLVVPFLPNQHPVLENKIKIGDTIINIEVADTAAERNKGLSGRDSLASDSGILFVFPTEKKYQFWMKEMKFPLDFIFIRNGKIVDLLPNIPPSSPAQQDQNLPIYEPIVPINMMLEVNSGFALSHNIQIGDMVFLLK